MAGTKVKLTDKYSGEEFNFRTMKDACDFLNRYDSYIYDSAKANKEFVFSGAGAENPSAYYYEVIKKTYAEISTGTHQKRTPTRVQLCAYCSHCNRIDCTYIASGGNLPVVGWKAEPDFVMVGDRKVDTYAIKECPTFKPDEAIIKGKAQMSNMDWVSLGSYADDIKQQRIDYQLRVEEFRTEINDG